MRRLAALGGVVAFAVGVATVLVPGLVQLDEVFLPLVGATAVLLALYTVRTRQHADRQRTGTPDPEVCQPAPIPGNDLTTTLAAFTDVRQPEDAAGTRAGLRRAVVRVLVRSGLDREVAVERVDEGTWTDDVVAARFLRRDSPGWSLRGRIRAAVGGESDAERGVRRTVDALLARAEQPGIGPVPDDGGASGWNEADGWMLDGRDPADVVATVTDGAAERLETGYWRGVSALALAGVGAGVLVEQPPVVLAAIAGLGYAAYARSGAPPSPSLAVERTVDETRPGPGEAVEVQVTVTNEGDRTLGDLRLVDGVPPALSVARGSPRLGTALRPGESATLSYAVAARRGVHEFGAVLAVVRDWPGSNEHAERVPAGGELTCIPHLRPVERVPLRARATRSAGQVETDSGGEGVEFHAVREYQPGDPPSRIDWHRRARTGELATVALREERAATVVLVVDAREAAYSAPAPGEPAAADRSVDAAGRLAAALLDAGNRVGLAALSPAECWVPPGAGRAHRATLRDRLATHPSLAPTPGGDTDTVAWQRRFRRRIPAGAQVVFCTPLTDGPGALVARQLEAHGVPVTVVSPDPTTTGTPGQRLARLARSVRVAELRRAGVRVVDWPWDQPLDAALERAGGRWSP